MRIRTLDLNFQGHASVLATYLLQDPQGAPLALVDPGPESTLPQLLSCLSELGIRAQDIPHVLITHIHLDHAGSAGWWAQKGARLWVHERGARHLIQPEKLWKSAESVYGNQLVPLWGNITPAPETKVTALKEGDLISLGSDASWTIRAYDTPGHARHHLAFHWQDRLFTGDVAGCRLPGSAWISVTGAPPQFDLEAYFQSVQRLRALSVSTLYLTHFGEVLDPKSHWDTYERELIEAVSVIREGKVPYETWCHDRARSLGVDAKQWERYEAINAASMTKTGIRMFCDQAS